jgi:hypothetical protein
MKSTPNLPASSRMQMPSGGGMKTPSMPKGSNPVTKKVMAGAKGKGMKKK